MQTEYARVTASPIGDLKICANDAGLCAIRFFAEDEPMDEHPLLLEAERQLNEYFAGRRNAFSVPLCLRGSEFQLRVWQALRSIPYGRLATYGEIAAAVGNAGAARAVGAACNRNPLPIIVPCHRVVGVKGDLTGYAGGLDIKRALLNIEKMQV